MPWPQIGLLVNIVSAPLFFAPRRFQGRVADSLNRKDAETQSSQAATESREAHGVRSACLRCRIQVIGSAFKSAGKPDALHTLRAESSQAANNLDRLWYNGDAPAARQAETRHRQMGLSRISRLPVRFAFFAVRFGSAP